LIKLAITGVYLTSNNLQNISSALRTNTVLEKLNLSGCTSTPENFHHLAQMLAVNNSLTSLDLTGTDLPEENLQQIAKSLTVNTSLQTLIMDANSLDEKEEGLQALLNAILIANTTLTELNISSESFSSETQKIISRLLSQNLCLSFSELDPDFEEGNRLSMINQKRKATFLSLVQE